MMKNNLIIFYWFFICFSSFCQTENTSLVAVLPEYFSPIFTLEEVKLAFLKKENNKNWSQYIYSSEDQHYALSIEIFEATRTNARTVLNNILHSIGEKIKEDKGSFNKISERQFVAEVVTDAFKTTYMCFSVPGEIYVFSFTTDFMKKDKYAADSASLTHTVNRFRYDKARKEGNVSMGHWGAEIHEYANSLSGYDPIGAEKVYDDLLSTSPSIYSAHIEYIRLLKNEDKIRESAEIVLKNAEDESLIVKAAEILNLEPKNLSDFPVLDKHENGLQLILIPLTPTNPWILEEAAEKYEKITNIPTKIRRLPSNWPLRTPERIYNQRAIERMIAEKESKAVDFSKWNQEKFVERLKKIANEEVAISSSYVHELIEDVRNKDGQYDARPLLNWFSNELINYRTDDDRTMYVGISAINIYSGDTNYVFSLHTNRSKSQASLLSYNMMTAAMLNEEYQSRDRLTERIAKELVPASLKSLAIPRSKDPTCPYSYSGGVARLDQKTMNLSSIVVLEIEKLRKRNTTKQ